MGPRQAQGVYIETTLLAYSIFGTELVNDKKTRRKTLTSVILFFFMKIFDFVKK